MSSEKVYEMQWDCKYCGTKKLLGKSQKFCPVCGAAQDPNTRYFPSDEERVAVQDNQFVGADLICPACSAPNSGNAEHCTQCGTPLDKAKRAQTVGKEEHKQGEKFAASPRRDLAKEKMDADLKRAKAADAAKARAKRRPFIIGGVIAAVAVVIGVIAFLFSTHQASLAVTGHSWERDIRIEDYNQRSASDWRDQMHSGAYNTSCSQKQRTTRQVADGQDCKTVREDKGDGSFSEHEECTTKYRDEPVYDTYCSYNYDSWDYSRTVTAKGDAVSPAPDWPAVTLKCEGQATYGCERVQGKDEKYIVHFKESSGDKTYDCTFNDLAKWTSFTDSSFWEMAVNRLNQASCDTLKPAAGR